MRNKSPYTLSKNNQYSKHNGKYASERISKCTEWQFFKVATLFDIRSTKSQLYKRNTRPADKTAHSSNTQEPSKRSFSTMMAYKGYFQEKLSLLFNLTYRSTRIHKQNQLKRKRQQPRKVNQIDSRDPKRREHYHHVQDQARYEMWCKEPSLQQTIH